MFWKRKKAKNTTRALTTGDISKAADNTGDANHANLDLRRAVLEWRDRQVENVERHLTRELNDLYRSLDQQLEKMSMCDLLKQGGFGKKHIEPVYQEWVTREVTQLSRSAQDDLSKVIARALEFDAHGTALDQINDSGHYKDAALAAASATAGIAAIPTFATMSVVSAGGLMGFLGATTIALPVVAVGVGIVGVLLALAGYRAASLKSRAIARYRKGITQSIADQVSGRGGDRDSICQRMQSYIHQTADQIIMEIDQ